MTMGDTRFFLLLDVMRLHPIALCHCLRCQHLCAETPQMRSLLAAANVRHPLVTQPAHTMVLTDDLLWHLLRHLP